MEGLISSVTSKGLQMVHLKSVHKRVRARVLRSTREQEIDLVLESITPHLNGKTQGLRVLEFGAGQCYQSDRLSRIGQVTATDLERWEADHEKREISFLISDMGRAPFRSNSFDVIYSNHVLEHLSDVTGSLAEISRIGKADALFAFTVPTRLWLLLAQPAVIGWKLAGLSKSWRQEGVGALINAFAFGGHGEFESFSDAYTAFGQSRWARLLETNGFHVLERVPLLVYAPAECLLPPSRNLARFGICSSILFVLRKENHRPISRSDVREDR